MVSRRDRARRSFGGEGCIAPRLNFACEFASADLTALFADDAVVEHLGALGASVALGLLDLSPELLGEVLHAASAYEPLAESLHLCGQFVGACDFVWYGVNNHGVPIVVRGELHVGWILDGRTIQDIWKVPLDPDEARRMRAFHGTTIRFYDLRLPAWRSNGRDPLNGRTRRFLGRPVGDTIVLDRLAC